MEEGSNQYLAAYIKAKKDVNKAENNESNVNHNKQIINDLPENKLNLYIEIINMYKDLVLKCKKLTLASAQNVYLNNDKKQLYIIMVAYAVTKTVRYAILADKYYKLYKESVESVEKTKALNAIAKDIKEIEEAIREAIREAITVAETIKNVTELTNVYNVLFTAINMVNQLLATRNAGDEVLLLVKACVTLVENTDSIELIETIYNLAMEEIYNLKISFGIKKKI